MIWSVSLVFYHPTLGYLIGQELRKKEKELMFQPVGGKVESFDKDPLDTGVREFIEETTLGMHSFFNNIAIENFKKWTDENGIDLNTKYPNPTTWIQKELYEFCSVSNYYIDYNCLNSHKIHRFYIVDISKINNNELNKNISYEIMNLPFAYNTLEPYFRLNDKMWSLYWIQLDFMKKLPQPSTLITVLHDKIKFNRSQYSNKNNFHNKSLHSKKEEKKEVNETVSLNEDLSIISNSLKILEVNEN